VNVLLVNDDGINAEGLWALSKAFKKKKHTVYVIAPKIEQSAMSSALTIREAIRIDSIKKNVWAVHGTPVDCVMLGFEYILKSKIAKKGIDLVVSGINAGPNLCSDIIYSGTVGAAIEAASFNYKAIAISINSSVNPKYDVAATVLLDLIDKGITQYIGSHEIININVPNVKIDDIKGYSICQTGFSRYQNTIVKSADGRNKEVFWISGNNPLIESGEYDIDTYAVKSNKIAISPLKIDYNNYSKFDLLKNWLKEDN